MLMITVSPSIRNEWASRRAAVLSNGRKAIGLGIPGVVCSAIASQTRSSMTVPTCATCRCSNARRLEHVLGRAERQVILFTEHLEEDGPIVFRHVCRMGLEGIVSKRTDARYRSGRSRTWLKSKNPASEAVRREREEEWNT